MNTEQLVIHESTQGKIVEHICTSFPHRSVPVLLQTLVVKTIYLCDLTTFMVSTKKIDTVRVSNLQSEEKEKCLNTVITSINIVAQKQIIRIRTVSAESKEFQDVVELAMNISTNLLFRRLGWKYGNGSVNLQNIPFICQNFLCFGT